MPEVSVIVPNYNHAPYLQQRIDSILNQTFRDFELILLDDCSTDNSRPMLELYRNHPQVSHIVYNDKNSGTPFRQWQKGMALAKGKWLWIAESDDYAEPAFLETLIQLTMSKPAAGIVYCSSLWVDNNGNVGKDLNSYDKPFYREGIEEIRNSLWSRCTIQNVSSCIMKRDLALTAINGLGHYRACGDWMFYVKVLQQAGLAFTAQKLNYFRYYHNNTSHWAEENGLWITEGIDVLKHIRYDKVTFPPGHFQQVVRTWYQQAKTIKGIRKYKTMFTIAMAVCRYLRTGFVRR
jgi:glycosyltransferase involved in cell wall biosynthesis